RHPPSVRRPSDVPTAYSARASHARDVLETTAMKAVILCGGQGTRIRDASEILPKALLPIGDKPVVWHIMKGFARHGVTDFVLCLGYKGWLIKEFFLNYRAITRDITVTLGTARDVAVHGNG